MNGVSLTIDSIAGSGDLSGGLGHLPTSSPVVIGDNWLDGHKFDGSIDEVRVYSRALSANEITALYDFEAPGFQ